VDVGVVIPCHRHARFLPVCLTSLALQTRPPAEVVIINDGGEENLDEAVAVAGDLLDAPIKMIKLSPTQGTAAARNIGFGRLSTRWVLPLDADDAIRPTFIESALKLAAGEDVIIYPDFQRFGNEREVARMRSVFDLVELCYSNYMIAGCLIPMKAWHRVREINGEGYSTALWRLGGYEDQLFFIECALSGYQGRHLPAPLYLYRRHPDSRTHSEQYSRNTQHIRSYRPKSSEGRKNGQVAWRPPAPVAYARA
jgi:glycosyltransferase involved in cell wall biosynthesis